MTKVSDEKPSGKDEDDGRGCAFIVGLFIVGCCIGNIYSAVLGWAVIGTGLIIISLLPASRA